MIRISAGRRYKMYPRTSLYSVMLLFSTVPNAGVISTVALKSLIALNCSAIFSMSSLRPAVRRGGAPVLAPVPVRVIKRRFTKQEESPHDAEVSRSRELRMRRNGIYSIVGGGETALSTHCGRKPGTWRLSSAKFSQRYLENWRTLRTIVHRSRGC